jgi:hypothetical protein
MANQDTKYEYNPTKDKWLVTYTRFRDRRTNGRTRVFQYTHHSTSGGIIKGYDYSLALVYGMSPKNFIVSRQWVIRSHCEFEYSTLCDKVCQWLVTHWWFSPGTLVSSINETDCQYITEILLKVALITINQSQWVIIAFYYTPTRRVVGILEL